MLLSDLGLPDGTGIDILDRLRRDGVKVAAIAMTGFGMEEDISRSAEAGFSQHLTKPINIQHLDNVIQETVLPGGGAVEASALGFKCRWAPADGRS